MTSPLSRSYYMKAYENNVTMCVSSLVPAHARDVHELLMANIWRSTKKRAATPLLSGSYKSGLLVCLISQSKIAARLGLNLRTVGRHVATLKKLGWLRIHEDSPPHASQHYVLGTVSNPTLKKARERELPYRDLAVLRAFREAKPLAKDLEVKVGDLPLAVLHACLMRYFVPIKAVV